MAFWFALTMLVLTVALGVETVVGLNRLARLADVPAWSESPAPKVSIVVAARDEASKIEAAVRSMLAQRYPAVEVVVVDDRSTDGTGAILERLAESGSRLEVVAVKELPDGWLGKNHALQVGADRATGEWLLFADADVHMHPEAVSRAVRYAVDRGVDHLAALPDLQLPGLLLSGFAAFFVYAFTAFVKPWRAKDPKSWFFVGVGAFNLVRKATYERVGGHRRIALRPDDDMKLGKILKRGGGRADVVRGGRGMLSVEWYHSLGEMVRGFEKNAFAGVEYSVILSVSAGILQLSGGVLPVVLAPFATGMTQAFLLAQIAMSVVTMGLVAREIRVPIAVALIYPVLASLLTFILWRTMFVNLAHGGLRWRGTFYSLKRLKANRV